MSSNDNEGKDGRSQPPLSAREAEVIERQRQMAARLAGGTTSTTTKRPTSGGRFHRPRPPPPPGKPPPPPPLSNSTKASSLASSEQSNPSATSSSSSSLSTQQRILQRASQQKRLDVALRKTRTQSIAGTTASEPIDLMESPSPPQKRKRPTVRSSSSSSSAAATTTTTTAASALASARERLGMSAPPPPPAPSIAAAKKGPSSSSSGAEGSVSVSAAVKVALKRPTMRNKRVALGMSAASSSSSGAGSGGSLASLLGPGSASFLQTKPKRHYPRIEPDDFFRDVREWDFLMDFNDRMKSQRQRRRGPTKEREGERKKGRKRPRPPPRGPPIDGTGGGGGRRGYDTVDDGLGKVCDHDEVELTKTKPRPPSASPSSSDGKEATAPPLPDQFESYREYMHKWSPLCLAEARAQLLSDVVSDVPYWDKKPQRYRPIAIKVTPLKKDVDGSTDYVTVRIQPRTHIRGLGGAVVGSDGGGGGGENGGGAPFQSNDVVLLVSNVDVLKKASIGELESNGAVIGKAGVGGRVSPVENGGGGKSTRKASRHGLLGHVDLFRRTVDGLVLRVSRKRWTGAGSTDMYLLRLGGNVTALREYTALCRIDTIPLLPYLLGEKMTPAAAKPAPPAKKKGRNGGVSSMKESKADLLDSMGGADALGKGFAKYARQKFNPSQLGAIAAAAREYGEGGFTLVKGPPGTGKTTTLVALLNSLHIRQFNKYFEEVRRLAALSDAVVGKRAALSNAAKAKPRLLVCAPSNAAVDNVILKIMEEGFVDGNGCRYNPSIVRVGVGQSTAVKDVALEAKVDALLSEGKDLAKLESTIAAYRMELGKLQSDITRLRRRVHAIGKASPWPLAKDWEIRIDEETFEETGRVFFVNHKEKRTTFEVPPPPEPGEKHFPSTSMPEYRSFMGKVVKMVERYYSISSKLEQLTLCQSFAESMVGGGRNNQVLTQIRQQLETHILDSVHIVMTTLGTAGNRALESSTKFEVVVVDEAAQSVEPATLVALQLGSSHAILVGDPQQLPATIFSVSGRSTKYDRSLFQRLEEAGHEVHLLDTQYRMHPAISDFPRRIFYDNNLHDGPNVKHPDYGNPLRRKVYQKFPAFQPFTLLDLESSEERGGTSLSNSAEAQLALHLYTSLKDETGGLSSQSRVAIITPYSQQAALLRRTFSQSLGPNFEAAVEVNTVDAFQGREANIVIFSCVRAAGSRGIGFLSDVRRMNVALTRAKHFLFVIAHCQSIVVNPYWRELVGHARETEAVVCVPMTGSRPGSQKFPDLKKLNALPPPAKAMIPARKRLPGPCTNAEDGEVTA